MINRYLLILTFCKIFSQNYICDNPIFEPIRAVYNIGDTISLEDQLRPYNICYSSSNIELDTFKLADFNGYMNGGNYKITLISMNAAW